MFRFKQRGPLGIVLVVIALGFSAYLVFSSAQPTVYTLTGTALKISAQFGETIQLSEINGVTLKDTLPDNLTKVSGANLGTILKGDFESGGTPMKVYVDTSVPPFIYLDTQNGLVILSDQTADKTQALYQELLQKTAVSGG